MSRPRAETMPAVTVPPRPKGLPIASTQSPTEMPSLSPNCTACSGLSVLMRSTAMSVRGSVPSSSARMLVLSCRMTLISSAPSMTWLFVTTMPLASTMKPEPSDCARRGRCGCSGPPWGPPGRLRLKKSRKNSSKGLPGGACGMSGASGRLARAWTLWVVEMLTTAGRSWRASGAKEEGASRIGTACGAFSGAAPPCGAGAGSACWAPAARGRPARRTAREPARATGDGRIGRSSIAKREAARPHPASTLGHLGGAGHHARAAGGPAAERRRAAGPVISPATTRRHRGCGNT